MTPEAGVSNRQTALERVLRHERAALLGVVAVVTIACWAWIVPMARDMYGAMTGPSAWMMRAVWDTPHLILLCAMWVTMMVAMMLPSAAPALMLYASVARRSEEAGYRTGYVYLFALGYIVIWAAFSVGATAIQRLLSNLLVLSPMMEVQGRTVAAGFLIAAGTFQLTPLKHVCLDACRSPISFLTERWRSGAAGAFRMGIDHGLFCLGCCWALMLLLFVGGVMNLFVIVPLAIFVLIEKVAPFGEWMGRLGGALLIGAAIWILVR